MQGSYLAESGLESEGVKVKGIDVVVIVAKIAEDHREYLSFEVSWNNRI